MEEFERKQLLERVEREGATVGAAIPDEISVQGETIDLHAFVFEIHRRETIPSGEHERVEQAIRNLRRERRQRKQRLEVDDLTYEAGEALVRSIVGIDRALAALEGLDDPGSIEEEADAATAADQKRWISFLRRALGREDDGGIRP